MHSSWIHQTHYTLDLESKLIQNCTENLTIFSTIIYLAHERGMANLSKSLKSFCFNIPNKIAVIEACKQLFSNKA